MVSSWHNDSHSLETEIKPSEDGVRLPTRRGNWKRSRTQSSHPMPCACTCHVQVWVHIPGDPRSVQLGNATTIYLIENEATSPWSRCFSYSDSKKCFSFFFIGKIVVQTVANDLCTNMFISMVKCFSYNDSKNILFLLSSRNCCSDSSKWPIHKHFYENS